MIYSIMAKFWKHLNLQIFKLNAKTNNNTAASHTYLTQGWM